MKNFQELDLPHVPLAGLILIEASAGTGKTYSIASLYLRLVMEQGLLPEQILVVTYTEAATKELKGRIRARLREALTLLRVETSGDRFLTGYFLQVPEENRSTCFMRLEHALTLFDTAAAWGKTPVHAKSTPGFIVNRIARPYYAETLALLQEQASTPPVLDACLRAVGFRMGPCELMDLIGHDTNFSVTQSVYEANFFDKRYQPSGVQRELVDGGLLGRKSGRGFYDHRPGAVQPALAPFEGAAGKLVAFLHPQGPGRR